MKITSPAPGFTGPASFADGTVLAFSDGVANVESLSPAVRSYLVGAGYGIDGQDATPPAPHYTSVTGPVDNVIGSPLRDAAVNPLPQDHLRPVNAGLDDPHGPRVVSPQLGGFNAQEDQTVSEMDPAGVIPQADVTVNAATGDADVVTEAVPVEGITPGTDNPAEPVQLEGDATTVVTDQAAPFDPSTHTVKEVTEYLATASASERERVLAAEGDGQKRAGILNA